MPDHLVDGVIAGVFQVTFLLDSGSDVDVLAEDEWHNLAQLFASNDVFLFDLRRSSQRRVTAFA